MTQRIIGKQAFVDQHKHQLCGLIADAAVTKATGAPLAEWLRGRFKDVDRLLGQVYDQLTAAVKLEVPPELLNRNGNVAQPEKVP